MANRPRRRHPARIERRITGAASAVTCVGMIVAIEASHAQRRPSELDQGAPIAAARQQIEDPDPAAFSLFGSAVGSSADYAGVTSDLAVLSLFSVQGPAIAAVVPTTTVVPPTTRGTTRVPSPPVERGPTASLMPTSGPSPPGADDR